MALPRAAAAVLLALEHPLAEAGARRPAGARTRPDRRGIRCVVEGE